MPIAATVKVHLPQSEKLTGLSMLQAFSKRLTQTPECQDTFDYLFETDSLWCLTDELAKRCCDGGGHIVQECADDPKLANCSKEDAHIYSCCPELQVSK